MDLAEVTILIKARLKTDLAKFVSTYTKESIAEKGSCKFYLIAMLEILKKTVDTYKDFTDLTITKTLTVKFSISVK
jgi:hypothetical protein